METRINTRRTTAFAPQKRLPRSPFIHWHASESALIGLPRIEKRLPGTDCAALVASAIDTDSGFLSRRARWEEVRLKPNLRRRTLTCS